MVGKASVVNMSLNNSFGTWHYSSKVSFKTASNSRQFCSRVAERGEKVESSCGWDVDKRRRGYTGG